MIRFISRRLLISIPVLLGITLVAFTALSLAPGDPILARIDPSILAQQSPEWIEQQRHELGLDQPVLVRYAKWLMGVVKGDLGFSIVTRRSIADELAFRLPATLQLMGAALLISLLLGIPFGVIAAVKQYSKLDYAMTTFTITMISTPTFFLGMLAIYVFGVLLHLFPTSGAFTLGSPPSFLDRLSHLVLPAGILGLANAAQLMRYTRASMLETLQKEYIIVARAKGLRESTIVLRHALRNALIPVITVIGFLLPELLAGAIVTEQIFAWPGMGFMAVRAAADRDPSLLMGVVLVVGTGVLLANLLADITYAIVNPRIRYS